MDQTGDFFLILVTGGLWCCIVKIAIATEFKAEYATHGLANFSMPKKSLYLHYALFLGELAERGYTRDTVAKLRDFILNQATQHWHTGSTRKRAISVFP